jgi:hypothetical protein
MINIEKIVFYVLSGIWCCHRDDISNTVLMRKVRNIVMKVFGIVPLLCITSEVCSVTAEYCSVECGLL